MCGVLNNYLKVATAQESEEHDEAKTLVQEGINEVLLRAKCIKMADASPAGWAIVEEYLNKEIADNEADDTKIKRAEVSALAKKKRKQEAAGSSSKRGRGGARGGRGGARTATSTESSEGGLDPFIWALLTQSAANFNSTAQGEAAPAVSKKLGPCYTCKGPHMQNACPIYKAQQAALQAQMASVIAAAPGNFK